MEGIEKEINFQNNEEVTSPYKKGLEELLKLGMFEGIADADYVSAFQDDSRTNLKLRDLGPNPERLLQKAISEISLTNFSVAVKAAEEASSLDPDNEEAHFEEGKAKLLLAMQKANAIQGVKESEDFDNSVGDLLKEAKRSFVKAIELDPNDEEAKEILEKLTALIESVKKEQGYR